MRKKNRLLFGMFVTTLLLLLWAHPVLAEDVYSTTTTTKYYRIPYGNGIDDNGDGIIDDMNETDVQYGEENYTANNNTIKTWHKDFTTEYGWDMDVENGIWIGGIMEELWDIDSSQNESVNPNQTPLSLHINDTTGTYEFSKEDTREAGKWICAVDFNVEIDPSDAMTGCQAFLYRSPLCFDPDVMETWYNPPPNPDPGNYTYYMLNIFNSSGACVYVSDAFGPTLDNVTGDRPALIYGGCATPDNSTRGTNYRRYYQRPMMEFRTGETYTFKEYFVPKDYNPINSIKIYMSRHQDIANDGYENTYIFTNSSYARMVPVQCSYGMILTVGVGKAGTERIIYSYDDSPDHPLYFDWVYINTQSKLGEMDDVKAIRFIMPIRTSMPLNVTLFVKVYSGGATWTSAGDTFNNITGTFIFDMNVTDPDAGEPNYYRFTIRINNLGEEEDQGMTYFVYPGEGSFHYVSDYCSGESQGAVFWDVMFDIVESAAALPGASESRSPDIVAMLVGFGLILIGILIMIGSFIVSSVSIPLAIAGIAFGSLVMGEGAALLYSGSIGISIPEFFGKQARAIQDIIGGIRHILGKVWDIFVQVIETLKNLGNALLHWGGIILEAIVQIIYFLAFLIVMMGWSLFLTMMKYVLHGDFEGAWRSAKKGYKSTVSPVKKVYKTTRKIQKGRAREQTRKAKGMRAEQRQERRTRAYERAQDYRVRSSQAYREEQEGLIDEEIGLALRARKIE